MTILRTRAEKARAKTQRKTDADPKPSYGGSYLAPPAIEGNARIVIDGGERQNYIDYLVNGWHGGNPKKPIREVNWRSILSIQTSKSIADISGTFSITLKDRQAKEFVHEMDVLNIGFTDRHTGRIVAVLRGLVDDVVQGGGADPNSSQETVTISGRCLAKYLQVTSMFLPVWDPSANVPTALMFGVGYPGAHLGQTAKKVGTTPMAIFNYLLRQFTFGTRMKVGAGIPNSRFWVDAHRRFEGIDGFEVPFVQFNEDTLATALKTFEIPGFTEAWMDEFGQIVYRRPQWDARAKYVLSTESLVQWSFSRSDAEVATYVEVVPAGDPGLTAANAQALAAGRAPVPTEYVNGNQGGGTQLGKYVDKEFIIESKGGKVTDAGRKNHWYRLQRRLGVRPQQVTSPLIGTQRQAQEQAQGLLQFYSRFSKTGQVTIPGTPLVRIGETLHLFGELEGQKINRTYYIEAVSHAYDEGQSFTTTLQLSHGRDPGDPKWGQITLPHYSFEDLVQNPGVGDNSGGGGGGGGNVPNQTPTAGGLVNPFGKHVPNITRIDQGIDAHPSAGDPYIAIADMRYKGTIPNWYDGGPYAWYEIVAGAHKGKYIYYSEGITRIATGFVAQGRPVGYATGASYGCELGWANSDGRTLASANGHVSQSPNPRAGGGLHHSPEGEDFFALMKVNGFVTGF